MQIISKQYLFRISCFFFLSLSISCNRNVTKVSLNEVTIHETITDSIPREANSCNKFEFYAPDLEHPDHFPERLVRVNVHFIRDGNGEHNFDLPVGRWYARKMIESANYKLRNNQKMNLPHGNNTPVHPVKYQYVLSSDPNRPGSDGIYVHDEPDPELAFFINKGRKDNRFKHDLYNKYGIQKDTVLNIFILSHPPDSLGSRSYRPKAQGVGYPAYVKMSACYEYLNDTVFLDNGRWLIRGPGFFAGLINHEIGHSLGLHHTWNLNDGCDDTPKNPGCWGSTGAPPCEGAVSNNMMDYNAAQDALTPCQLGKVHFNFARTGSRQRSKLLEKWCVYNAGATIYVRNGEDIRWNSHRDMEGNIIVQNGGKLTLQCRVHMPAGAKIIVQAGGHLVLDGSTITNLCGDEWGGIEVWESKQGKGMVSYGRTPVFENMAQPVEPN